MLCFHIMMIFKTILLNIQCECFDFFITVFEFLFLNGFFILENKHPDKLDYRIKRGQQLKYGQSRSLKINMNKDTKKFKMIFRIFLRNKVSLFVQKLELKVKLSKFDWYKRQNLKTISKINKRFHVFIASVSFPVCLWFFTFVWIGLYKGRYSNIKPPRIICIEPKVDERSGTILFYAISNRSQNHFCWIGCDFAFFQRQLLCTLFFFFVLSHKTCESWMHIFWPSIHTQSHDRIFYLMQKVDDFQKKNVACWLSLFHDVWYIRT